MPIDFLMWMEALCMCVMSALQPDRTAYNNNNTGQHRFDPTDWLSGLNYIVIRWRLEKCEASVFDALSVIRIISNILSFMAIIMALLCYCMVRYTMPSQTKRPYSRLDIVLVAYNLRVMCTDEILLVRTSDLAVAIATATIICWRVAVVQRWYGQNYYYIQIEQQHKIWIVYHNRMNDTISFSLSLRRLPMSDGPWKENTACVARRLQIAKCNINN